MTAVVGGRTTVTVTVLVHDHGLVGSVEDGGRVTVSSTKYLNHVDIIEVDLTKAADKVVQTSSRTSINQSHIFRFTLHAV
jgi:hypothetical protein